MSIFRSADPLADVTKIFSIRYLWGHPYMTSALRGEGVSPKEDVVREVA